MPLASAVPHDLHTPGSRRRSRRSAALESASGRREVVIASESRARARGWADPDRPIRDGARSRCLLQVVWTQVLGLVHPEAEGFGDFEFRQPAPGEITDWTRRLDPLRPKFGQRHFDVVTQQEQLSAISPVSWVDAEFRRRQREDRPGTARVDAGQPEDIAEEGADRIRLVGVDDGMDAGDPPPSLQTLRCAPADAG